MGNIGGLFKRPILYGRNGLLKGSCFLYFYVITQEEKAGQQERHSVHGKTHSSRSVQFYGVGLFIVLVYRLFLYYLIYVLPVYWRYWRGAC